MRIFAFYAACGLEPTKSHAMPLSTAAAAAGIDSTARMKKNALAFWNISTVSADVISPSITPNAQKAITDIRSNFPRTAPDSVITAAASTGIAIRYHIPATVPTSRYVPPPISCTGSESAYMMSSAAAAHQGYCRLFMISPHLSFYSFAFFV